MKEGTLFQSSFYLQLWNPAQCNEDRASRYILYTMDLKNHTKKGVLLSDRKLSSVEFLPKNLGKLSRYVLEYKARVQMSCLILESVFLIIYGAVIYKFIYIIRSQIVPRILRVCVCVCVVIRSAASDCSSLKNWTCSKDLFGEDFSPKAVWNYSVLKNANFTTFLKCFQCPSILSFERILFREVWKYTGFENTNFTTLLTRIQSSWICVFSSRVLESSWWVPLASWKELFAYESSPQKQ